ncbi:chemotaxis protein CheB, partial [Piscinibacter sp.]|uniref:chemotaxis protein CheB n=1 Tax=Piscinibacter sp. TaxID=1903157 RepID=UPI0037830895
AIASSTGGPSALIELFSRIPERFPGAILIAQHMPDNRLKVTTAAAWPTPRWCWSARRLRRRRPTPPASPR